MQGTTVCPHCDTRFKISKEQLQAHHGMVRCGHCMLIFDTQPNFTPDQLDLQLELPVLDNPIEPYSSKTSPSQPMTLAEQVAIVRDNDSRFPSKQRTWPWSIAALLLLLALLAQATYFFRVDLAAHLPGLKPVLSSYCRILKCSIPLPQHPDLIGIESSELEADPTSENQINLNALLRNRATYSQAFPNLELTLNDIQDKPLARRIFLPADYLPPSESETLGLPPNHEVIIKLRLNTTGIKPSGYRLMLQYPNS
jgi:predicted Zn finger-like uncharacterized protein